MNRKKYAKQHYEQNKSKYLKRAHEFTVEARFRNRQFILEYKQNSKCADCGNSNPIVLDFAHIDRDTKENDVSVLANVPVGLEKLKAEINKCIILCANCHRIKTFEENKLL